jgi:uncharacterized membrane protein
LKAQTGGEAKRREHGRVGPLEVVVVGVLAGLAAGYWTVSSLLIHRSFHSNGWDLGLINQVLWNSANGHLFEYSFRNISYAGDHWQPFLLVLVPLKWVHAGPEPLLVVQAAVLAAAVVPLYAAVRPAAGRGAAGALVGAYLLGLGVARTVSFDFHLDAFAPLLAFGALWALTRRKRMLFLVAGLLILTLKEDGALLALALCWIAWFAFGERLWPTALAVTGILYGLLANAVIIPHFLSGDLNPFTERYGYLGDSFIEILWSVVARPDLVIPRLARAEAVQALAMILASSALLPLLVPRLLPPLALVTLIPLLSKDSPQGSLELHYLLVPSTVAMLVAAVATRERVWEAHPLTSRLHWANSSFAGRAGRLWLPALVGVPAVLLLLWSPLPPSFSADLDRFDVAQHASVAREFVQEIPADIIISAQSSFVPHLSERRHVYEFPRVLDAEVVLLDEAGPIPTGDLAAGYADCLAALPRLGFDETRRDDGISLWRKVRPAESVPDAPPGCSGQ